MRCAQEEDTRELYPKLLVLVECGELAVVLTLMQEWAVDAFRHGVVIPRRSEASLAETYLPVDGKSEVRLAAYNVALVCVVPCSNIYSDGEKLRFERFQLAPHHAAILQFVVAVERRHDDTAVVAHLVPLETAANGVGDIIHESLSVEFEIRMREIEREYGAVVVARLEIWISGLDESGDVYFCAVAELGD